MAAPDETGTAPTAGRALRLRGRTFTPGSPAVMAIINRTDDSFFSDNRHLDDDSALRAADDAVAAGADILDIGGVRAGQQGAPVDVDEEIRRVVPFLAALSQRHPQVLLSLDTWRSQVARAAAGTIDLVNDTWAGYDAELAQVAAAAGAGIVVSHAGGLPPRTDPDAVRYTDEQGDDEQAVLRDVLRTLRAGAQRARDAGVPEQSILVDPTLDFGKTTRHSLLLVRRTADIAALGFPVLQAISRKDFVGETLDLSADQRLEGSLAATAVAAWLGAVAFRTHDVRATRRVLDMVASIRGDRPPARAERGEP